MLIVFGVFTLSHPNISIIGLEVDKITLSLSDVFCIIIYNPCIVKIIPSSLKTLFNSLTKLLTDEKLDFDIITFEFEVTTPDIRHTVKILCFPNTVLNVGNRIEWSPISSPNLSDMGLEISFLCDRETVNFSDA